MNSTQLAESRRRAGQGGRSREGEKEELLSRPAGEPGRADSTGESTEQGEGSEAAEGVQGRTGGPNPVRSLGWSKDPEDVRGRGL